MDESFTGPPSRPSKASPVSVRTPSSEAVRRFRHRNEFSRARDVFRHLHPWVDTYQPVALYKHAWNDSKSSSTPKSCPDTTLSALAQLCALRMDCRACLITLVCRKTEYVLVESTKQASLQHSVGNVHNGNTWIGTSSFEYEQGLTSQAIDEWCKARRLREEPKDEGHYYTEGLSPHWFLISDVRQGDQVQGIGIVEHGPWIRFYCSVPLRSAQGSVIGSLTMLDDRPRYGVSSPEMTLLEDISDTVVQHLDATAVRAQRQRSERFIQSLSLFNTGEDSMRDWWQNQDDMRVLNMGRNVAKGTASDRQGRVDAQFGVQDSLTKSENVLSSLANKAIDDSAMDTPPMQQQRRPDIRPKQRTSDNFSLAKSSALLYGRATNLLREALGADGVVQVNAAATTTSLQREDSSDESDSGPGGNTNLAASKSMGDAEGITPNTTSAQLCEVLSFSTRARSSVRGHKAAPNMFNLPVPYLQRLIRRYPQGSVFHFDQESKVFVPSTDDSAWSSTDDAAKQKSQRRKDEAMLSEIVKGAHSFTFYPLEGNDRWRSCIFVWRTEEMAFFNQSEDLPYLRTFGHSLMAELARLESMASDYAKGTFISSISHELRSPLHGILAAAEFLDETELNPFQLEMTHAIGTAGKQLLDTVNHILDHSKISSFMRASKGRTGPADTMRYDSLSGSPKQANLASGVDLALLTEEVIETCVASHRSHFRQAWPSSSHQGGSSLRCGHRDQTTYARADTMSDVSVTLNIAQRESWMVDIQPGAWTRIITNLVGNALKYTTAGHISVHLDLPDQSIQPDADGHNRIPVQLVVEDTGIGMSQKFLAQDLFTPFKQEDPHSAGTGLGLSIVKQIAQDLNAELGFSSTQGRGTRITLRFVPTFMDQRVASSASDIPPGLVELPLSTPLGSIHLITQSTAPELGLSASEQRLDSAGGSAVDNAKEWLQGMVSRGPHVPNMNKEGTAVCAITERSLLAWSASDPKSLATMLETVASQYSHILVLAGSIQSVAIDESVRRTSPLDFVFLHQPVGPRKLLKAMIAEHESFALSTSPRRLSEPDTSQDHVETQDFADTSVTEHASGHPRRRGQIHTTSLPDKPRLMPTHLRSESSSSLDFAAPSPWTPTSRAFVTSPSATSEDEKGRSLPPVNVHPRECKADTVLLVEDNEVNMRMLVALMNKLQRPYHCVENGLDALTAYRENPHAFFLVLMDMSMPIMDGFTATAKFRETEQKYKLTPVYICALTGVTSEEARARAFTCGVDEFFSKPVKIKELRMLLEKVEREVAALPGRKS